MNKLELRRGTYGPHYGARILDRYIPGWWDMVSLPDLDMYSTDQCVAGQVFRDKDPWRTGFGWVVDRAPIGDWPSDTRLDQVERLGLVAADDTGTYMELHIVWLELIVERHAQNKA